MKYSWRGGEGAAALVTSVKVPPTRTLPRNASKSHEKAHGYINVDINVIAERVFSTFPTELLVPSGFPIKGVDGCERGIFLPTPEYSCRGTGLENSHFMISCNKLYVLCQDIDASPPRERCLSSVTSRGEWPVKIGGVNGVPVTSPKR